MLERLALPFLLIGLCTALMIVKDIIRHPHPLKVMNFIWPLTGLYMPFIGWLAWWYLGRQSSRPYSPFIRMHPARGKYSRWQPVFISTILSAAACVFSDIITLTIITLIHHYGREIAIPVQALLCLSLAFFTGLCLQFFAIRQDENVSSGRALILSFKTETFPLLIYQLGVFFFMWLALKFVLNQQINPLLHVFWFMLQMAILTGFIFCWPANRFLIKRGLNPTV